MSFDQAMRESEIWLCTVGLDPRMGGVGSVARTSLRVLNSHWPGRVRVISLEDSREDLLSRGLNEQSFVACDGNRWRFALECMKQVVRKPELILFDHIDLAQCQSLLPRSMRSPFAVWLHGVEVWKRLNRLRTKALESAARLICNSQFTLGKATKYHDLSPRAMVVPLCIESVGSCEITKPASPKNILTVARLVKDRPKGHREILAAIPNVIGKVGNVNWHVVGAGPWLGEFRQLVEASPAKDSIVIHGFTARQQRETLYKKAHVFCMPSRGEGFGLVYLEALSHGCVCIGSKQDAAQEVLGDSGVFVDLDEPNDLTRTLISALTEESGRQKRERDKSRLDQYSYSLFAERLQEALTFSFGSCHADRYLTDVEN